MVEHATYSHKELAEMYLQDRDRGVKEILDLRAQLATAEAAMVDEHERRIQTLAALRAAEAERDRLLAVANRALTEAVADGLDDWFDELQRVVKDIEQNAKTRR